MISLNKTFKYTFISIVVAEILSLLGYLYPTVGQVCFLIILLLALILSLKKLEYGLYILLAELFIGSKGYLFFANISHARISIRIALFTIIFLVWIFQRIKKDEIIILKNKIARVFLIFGVYLIIGFLVGIKNNGLGNAFFDFNAWIFFAAAFIFFDTIDSKEVIKNVVQILLAASTWLSLKTIGILISFSRGLDWIGGPFYKWIRDTGVGEVTHVSGTVFRIFIQSQLYVMIGFLIALAFVIYQKKLSRKEICFSAIYLYLTSLTILISQSRSFWVGGVCGLGILFILARWQLNLKIKKTALLAVLLIAMVISETFVINVLTANYSGNLIASRFENLEKEAAGLSRINQLQPLKENIFQQMIFGYGFGKTLTYQSNDPRILQTHPGGIYTTYAFEWGYLDIWLKIGLVGLLLYLFLIYEIIKFSLKNFKENPALTAGLLAGLIFILITNIFSPYLNHPLGIGYLMLMSAITMVKS